MRYSSPRHNAIYATRRSGWYYSHLRIAAFVLALCCAAGCAMGALVFWEDQRGIQEAPVELTLREFIQRRPLDNRHVILRDFVFCEGHAFEMTPGGDLDKAWLPIVPIDEQVVPPFPMKFEVVVYLPSVHKEWEFNQFAQRRTVQGVIRRGSPPPGIARILKQDFPQTDYSNCFILDVGKRRLPPVVFPLAIAGTVVFTIVAFVVLAYHLFAWRATRAPRVMRITELYSPADDEAPERDRMWND